MRDSRHWSKVISQLYAPGCAVSRLSKQPMKNSVSTVNNVETRHLMYVKILSLASLLGCLSYSRETRRKKGVKLHDTLLTITSYHRPVMCD